VPVEISKNVFSVDMTYDDTLISRSLPVINTYIKIYSILKYMYICRYIYIIIIQRLFFKGAQVKSTVESLYYYPPQPLHTLKLHLGILR